MNTKNFFGLAASFASVLLAADFALAEPHDATWKALGSRTAPSYSYRPVPRTYAAPRVTTPEVAQAAPATNERRMFSQEPQSVAPPCDSPAMAAVPQERRSYSYEPEAPVYRSYSGGRSTRPAYTLPRAMR